MRGEKLFGKLEAVILKPIAQKKTLSTGED